MTDERSQGAPPAESEAARRLNAAAFELGNARRDAVAAGAEVDRLKAEVKGWRERALAIERENVAQRVFVAESAAEVHVARVRIAQFASQLEEVWKDHDRIEADAARVHSEAARLASLRVFRYTLPLRTLYGRLLKLFGRSSPT